MLLIPLLRIFTDWHLTGTYPALWLAHTPNTTPMPYVIRSPVGQYDSDWQFMTSAALISMALPLIIFFSLQRYFVTGLTAGSVKG